MKAGVVCGDGKNGSTPKLDPLGRARSLAGWAGGARAGRGEATAQASGAVEGKGRAVCT